MPLVWATGPRLCGRCGAQLGWQRFWLEAITGAVCAGIAWWLGWSWELPAFEILALACVALAGIDLATHRLPDHLLVQVGAAFGSLLLLAAAAGGQWADLARAACGGLLAFALYLVLALTGGLGMGDVKLASLLGTSLAWLGWDVWLVGVAAAPVFAALWVAVVGQARPRVGSAIAFAPFMTAAALVGILAGSQLVGWYAALQVG